MKPTKNILDQNDPLKDSIRITKLGRFIRDHGFDELPQIFNIIRGEMNFIGPRPLPIVQYEKLKVEYPDRVAQIDFWWKNRLSVLPGLSGWHQINLVDHNIIKYDLEYSSNPSFFKKVKIFIVSAILLLIGKRRYFKSPIPDTYEYVLD